LRTSQLRGSIAGYGYETTRTHCDSKSTLACSRPQGIRWMNAISDLSYSIYLIHALCLMLFGGWVLELLLASTVGKGSLSILPFLTLTMTAAAVVHQLIEVPRAKLMRIPWLRPRFRT
jgi:peptidoglycan/LPS O-acetylase OafA/YrhL